MTQELRKLANEWIERECDEDDIQFDGGSTSTNKLMRAYIAAANPAAILSLLDRLEKAEKDAARYRWLRAGNYPHRIATSILNDTPFGIDNAVDRAMEASK